MNMLYTKLSSIILPKLNHITKYKQANLVFKFLNKYWLLISFILASLISFYVIYQSIFYRWFGYETIPIPITDEFDYAWQGLSLRSNGLPVAWTILTDVYKNPKLNPANGNIRGFEPYINGEKIDINKFKKDPRPITAVVQIDYMKGLEYMTFVAPFFDHPPLGGLIYSLGENKNVSQLDQVKPDDFRKPALVMAIVTASLLFIFLFLITSNAWVAVLGVIIYSTVPTYLLATRTAFSENVIPPFVLAYLILLFLSLRVRNETPWAKINSFLLRNKNLHKSIMYILAGLSGLLAGLSVIAKETALGFIIGTITLLIVTKCPKKLIALFLLFVLIPIGGYIFWGLWLQYDLFIEIFKTNSNRGFFGALRLDTMLQTLRFKDFPTDGWWIWGFISLFFVTVTNKNKNILFLILPFMFHFILVLFVGGSNYPWYFIAMIPFLAGFSAIFIWNIFKNPTITTSLAFFLIPFSSSYYWGRVALNLQPSINHYREIFLIFILFLALRLYYAKWRITTFVWLALMAFLTYRIIIIYNQLFMPYLIAHWGNLPVASLPTF